jgi:6-phosphogluconolactonase
MRLCFTFMTALRTLQHQSVLAELVAQFVDVKARGHSQDCCPLLGAASIQFRRIRGTVWNAYVPHLKDPTRGHFRHGSRCFRTGIFVLFWPIRQREKNMRFRAVPVLCLIAASLASCNGTTPGCSKCTTTVNLDGSVSGLLGFRLELQNGTTPLSIALNGSDANGSQTFGTVAVNTSYSITVKTQPTSPSQTCVVANGAGTSGTSNVTNIAVTCTINPPRFLYVANRGSGDVSAYTIDAASGNLTPIAGSPFAAGGNPVAIVVDPTGAYVYVVNQLSANVSAFTINRTTGALMAAGAGPIGTGSSPTSVAIDPSSTYVYVTGGGSGGTVSVYAITAGTGVLTAVAGSLAAAGRLPAAVTVDPLGEFVYVANQSDGTFSAYSISASNGTLTAAPNSPYLCGASPQALALDPTGNNLYVANSAANTLTGINGLPPTASAPPGTISGSPYATGITPSSIAVDPVANTVYVADQGANTVSGFKIGGAGGALSAIPGSPFAAGMQPSAVAVDPTSLFIYAANSGSNTLSAYTINPKSGALTPLSVPPAATGLIPVAMAISD